MYNNYSPSTVCRRGPPEVLDRWLFCFLIFQIIFIKVLFCFPTTNWVCANKDILITIIAPEYNDIVGESKNISQIVFGIRLSCSFVGRFFLPESDTLIVLIRSPYHFRDPMYSCQSVWAFPPVHNLKARYLTWLLAKSLAD